MWCQAYSRVAEKKVVLLYFHREFSFGSFVLLACSLCLVLVEKKCLFKVNNRGLVYYVPEPGTEREGATRAVCRDDDTAHT